MSPGRDDDSDSSSEQSNEKCRKCRRKVLHASVKCAKCNEIYHERCFQILVGKGKKFCVITDSMMLCEEHCRQISRGDLSKSSERTQAGKFGSEKRK
jgi:hypothetical protein